MSDFDDIKDQINFQGFSEAQQETILGQLEDAWETESGREMIEAGLNLNGNTGGNGLTYINMNSQAELQAVGARFGMSAGQVTNIGNFALPSDGQVFLNGYDSIDPSTGAVEVYTDPSLAGQTAVADTPIRSLDHDGTVFSVPPVYTMIHETNHAATGERDLADSSAILRANRNNGQYYEDGSTGDSPGDYYGPNEVTSQEILSQMGYTQFRGSYLGTSLRGRGTGDEYGLGEDSQVAITTGDTLDMSVHDPIDTVTVNVNGSAATMRLGNGRDTVHAFDRNDIIFTAGGDDRIFAGRGDDTIHAGWGNQILDGGEANLDPSSDHLSDSSTNWGVDTVSYQSLPEGFAAPNLMTADGAFDGVARDGVYITMDGDNLSVNKGQENSVRLGDDIDTLNNIDVVVGTDRDDLADVSSLTTTRALSGGDGTDTLRIDGENMTQVEGAVRFGGASYDGYITDGTHRLYYTDYENIVLPETGPDAVEAHINANQADASVEAASAPQPTGSSLEEIIEYMRDNSALMRENLMAREDQGTLSEEEQSLLGILGRPEAISAFEALQEHGIEHLDVQIDPAKSPEENGMQIYSAVSDEMDANNIRLAPGQDIQAEALRPEFTRELDEAEYSIA